MKDRYEQIIDLPCPTSSRHPKMEREARAAQFAPFSALTGYDLAIFEAARLTEREIELNEDMKERLDRWSRLLSDIVNVEPKLRVTYFIADERKSGGRYKTVEGRLTAFDRYKKTITIDKREVVSLSFVKDIRSELFAGIFEEE